MTLEELLDQLRQLSTRQYSYVALAAVGGPLLLRAFGLKILAPWVRPLAVLVLLGGMYAKQEQARGGSAQTAR